jgi:hypothetical protein
LGHPDEAEKESRGRDMLLLLDDKSSVAFDMEGAKEFEMGCRA